MEGLFFFLIPEKDSELMNNKILKTMGKIKSALYLYEEVKAKRLLLKKEVRKLIEKYDKHITEEFDVMVNCESVGLGSWTVRFGQRYTNEMFLYCLAKVTKDIEMYNLGVKLVGDAIEIKEFRELHPFKGMTSDDFKELIIDSNHKCNLSDKIVNMKHVMNDLEGLFTQEELVKMLSDKVDEKELLK